MNDLLLAAGIGIGLWAVTKQQRPAQALANLDPTPLASAQPSGPSALPAVQRMPTTRGGRFVVVESIDMQHHTIETHWDSFRTRISESIDWVEQNSGLIIDCDLEPYYIVAPWTQEEMKAVLNADSSPGGEAALAALLITENAGLFQDVGFVGLIIDGFQESAWAWTDGPFLDGSLPPTFVLGDCVGDTWMSEDVPNSGIVPVCADFVGPQWPSNASSADGQTAAFIHELFHTVGGPWLPHEPVGTPMLNWWDFPNLSLSQAQVSSLGSGGFVL